MTHLLKRAVLACALIVAAAFAVPAFAAVDCTTAMTPTFTNTRDTAQFELWQKICAAQTGTADGDPTQVEFPDSVPVPLPAMAAANATLVVDMEHYGAMSLNVSAMPASSVISFTDSEDGLTNPVALAITPHGSPSGNGTLTQISTTGAWTIARRGRFMHITMTTYGGSGSLTGQYTLLKEAPPPSAIVAHGAVADSATMSGYPVPVGCKVMTGADTTLANGDVAVARCGKSGALITRPYAPSDLTWSGSVTITNSTTPVQIKGAAGSGIKNYVEKCQVMTDTLGAANTLQIQDGSGGTALYPFRLQTTSVPFLEADLGSIGGTANTGIYVATTGATTGGVYVNCHGHMAP